MAKYKFEFTPENVRKIEYILPKLKYSRYINNVIKWLENFEESEIELAYDFLAFFEYITMDELQYRLVEQLSIIDKKIPEGYKVILVPFAKYVKSNDIVAYLISKTWLFNDMEKRNRIVIERDFERYTYTENTALVLIDDFVGTGESFATAYLNRNIELFINNNHYILDEPFLLSAIIMEKGLHFLSNTIPRININAILRYNNFSSTNSPFIISYGPVVMEKLATKYGNTLEVSKKNKKKIYTPLGYGDCGALVSFDYGPPNNTIPIIWCSSNNWFPIFPRYSKDKMSDAKALKKTIAFYLGVMKKLNLNIYEDKTIKVSGKNYNYDSRADHSLVTVLYLLERKHHEILICQILGLTISELNEIYNHGKEKNFLDQKNMLTLIGSNFISKLIKEARGQKFRSKKRENFEIKNLIFVPKKFKGLV